MGWAGPLPTCLVPVALLGDRQGSHPPGEGPLLADREIGQVSIETLHVTTSLGLLLSPPAASCKTELSAEETLS